MRTRTAKHKRAHREDYYALAHIHANEGLTDRELGDKMGWDWENNGNKRMARIERHLTLFARRVKLGEDKKKRWFKVHASLREAQRDWIRTFE